MTIKKLADFFKQYLDGNKRGKRQYCRQEVPDKPIRGNVEIKKTVDQTFYHKHLLFSFGNSIAWFTGLSMFFIIFILLVSQAIGASYYVDSAVTDTYVASATPDFTTYNPTTFATDTGTASVYKTLADINAFAGLQPGDFVYYRKGQQWREMLTAPASGSAGLPITFGAYGSGEKPIISGADLVTTWIENAGSEGGPDGSLLLDDNFDDDDISDWEAAVGTVVAANDRVEATVDNSAGADRIRKSFASQTEAWASFDYTISGTIANSEYSQGMGLTNYAGYHKLAYIGYTKVSGVIYWQVVARTDGGTETNVQQTESLSIDTTYHVVVRWKAATGAGNNDGIVQFYVDGTLIYELTNIDNDTLACTGVLLGSNYAVSAGTSYIYVDNMKASATGSAPVAPYANVWQASLTTEPSQVFFDGTRGTLESGVATLSAANEWYWSANVLSVYATSDPDTAYTNPGIEASIRTRTVLVNGKDYVTVEDIDCLKSKTSGQGSVYLNNSVSAIVDGLTLVDNDGFAGIYAEGSGAGKQIKNNIISYTRHTDEDRGAGIILDGAAGSHTISGNTIHHSWATGIRLNMWTATSSNTIEQNTIYSSGSEGIALYADCASNIIQNNNIYSNGTTRADTYGINLAPGAGNDNIVRYNLTHDHTYISADAGGIRFDTLTSTGNQAYYNISYNERNGIHILNSTKSIILYNNSIYNSGVTGIWVHGATSDGHIVKNNIIHTAGTNLIFNQDATNSVINYNLYYPDTGTPFNWNDTSYDWADWLTNSGQDANSPIPSDPLFISTSDFHLQPGSPAINAGTNSGAVTNDNMRISGVNGTAFVDFSVASALIPYIGARLTISDSEGAKLIGYIKAAGSAETLGDELFTDPSFDAVTKAALKSVVGITKANPGVVTFGTGHGYVNGDIIYFHNLTEMTELNTQYWQLRGASGDTFQLATVYDTTSLDTSGYGTAETTGGNCAQRVTFTNWTPAYATWVVGVDGAGALTGKAVNVGSGTNQVIYQVVTAPADWLFKLVTNCDALTAGDYTGYVASAYLSFTDVDTVGAVNWYGSNANANRNNGINASGSLAASFTSVSLKQVLTPSATGVTIVSAKNGSTYNWNSHDSGFNYNDSGGYTYTITRMSDYAGRPVPQSAGKALNAPSMGAYEFEVRRKRAQ